MAIEDWAKHIIENHLGRTVVVNDDGSKDSMYDLRVESGDDQEAIAIECVGAVNSAFTELWNIGPGKGPLYLSVEGDWLVIIRVDARLKRLKKHLESILRELEARNILDTGNLDQWYGDDEFIDSIVAVGISSASNTRLKGTGKVFLTTPGIGGAVDDDGGSIAEWVGEFLGADAQRDVVSKLVSAETPQREVFVAIAFSGAPFAVESYFTGDLINLPAKSPKLPEPIDGVWIASSMGYKGIRWNRDGWDFFEIRSG